MQPVATAASTALPPAFIMSTPACEASSSRTDDDRMLSVVGTQSGCIGSLGEPEHQHENEQLAVKAHACGKPLETAPDLMVKLRLAQRASDSQIRRVTPR